jgi:hypothetical protein
MLLYICSQIYEAKAWGPITHCYICDTALKRIKESGRTSELYNIIVNNYEWFKCGLMYPDVTVLYYYTNWTNYQFTHSWYRQKIAWEKAKEAGSERAMAFALGWGAHLIQDAIVHNVYIPAKIKSSLIQNNIIHPLTEGVVETKVIDPNYFGFYAGEDIAKTAFDEYNKPFSDGTSLSNLSPVQFAEQVTGAPPEFENTANQFYNILSGGGFGTMSFKGYALQQQKGPLWDLYKTVSKAVAWIMRNEDPEPYIEQAIDVTVKWILEGSGAVLDNDGGTGASRLDPTGEKSLNDANSYVGTITFLVVIVFVSVVVFISYRKFKKRRE